MKNPDLLDEVLGTAFHHGIDCIVDCQTDNFVSIVDAAGLDRGTAFKFSDLREVDFSGCDLTGFDFTGADLRGSVAVSALWDETTIFEGAILEGSPFAHSVTLERSFATNPEAQKVFQRLKKQGVFEKSAWILNKADQTDKQFDLNKIVALKLFDGETNFTVRNSLIYGAKSYFSDQSEYRDFITNIFAQRSTDTTTFRAALNVLAKVFNYDETVQTLLLTVLRNCEFSYKLAAIEGLVGSRDYAKLSSMIRNDLFSSSLAGFRAFLHQKASEETTVGRSSRTAKRKVQQPASSILGLLDFSKPIDNSTLVKLIARALADRSEKRGAFKSFDAMVDGHVKELSLHLANDPRQFQSALSRISEKRKSEDVGLPDWARDVRDGGKLVREYLAKHYRETGIKYRSSGSLSKAFNLQAAYSTETPQDLGRVSSILFAILS